MTEDNTETLLKIILDNLKPYPFYQIMCKLKKKAYTSMSNCIDDPTIYGIYTNYDFYYYNLAGLINQISPENEFVNYPEKILDAYVENQDFEVPFGTKEQFAEYIESLTLLFFGNPRKYLKSYRSLLEENKKPSI